MLATALRIEREAYPKPFTAWCVVGILLLANLSCYLARMVIILLMLPIGRDLHASDTKMSLLQGAAFSIFFVVCGLPAGWLADRSGRRNILIAAILIWSVMAAFCGLASNYTELFLARIGVGIGEAALTPAALSMIADYFAPGSRGRAMAVYYMGALFGTGAATTIGALVLQALNAGWRPPLLDSLAPWQALFCLSGVPGLFVAAMLLAVREPSRHETLSPKTAAGRSAQIGLIGYMAPRWRAFVPVYLSLTAAQFCGFAVTGWVIPLLVRRVRMDTSSAGEIYGILMIIFGVLASILGGTLGDRFAVEGRPGGRFRAVIYCYLFLLPGVAVLSLATGYWSAGIGLILELVGVCMAASMMYAVVQDIVPNQLRGQAVALLSMMATLIGATLAPTAVALVTDLVFHDPDKVGYSMFLVVLPAAAAGLALTLTGLRPYSAAVHHSARADDTNPLSGPSPTKWEREGPNPQGLGG